jgi:hypothetical protein
MHPQRWQMGAPAWLGYDHDPIWRSAARSFVMPSFGRVVLCAGACVLGRCASKRSGRQATSTARHITGIRGRRRGLAAEPRRESQRLLRVVRARSLALPRGKWLQLIQRLVGLTAGSAMMIPGDRTRRRRGSMEPRCSAHRSATSRDRRAYFAVGAWTGTRSDPCRDLEPQLVAGTASTVHRLDQARRVVRPGDQDRPAQ